MLAIYSLGLSVRGQCERQLHSRSHRNGRTQRVHVLDICETHPHHRSRSDDVTQREQVSVNQKFNLLPRLLGVFGATLLALVTRSCDSFMIASLGSFTENVSTLAFPEKDEQHDIRTGRLTSLVIVAGGLIPAYSFCLRFEQ